MARLKIKFVNSFIDRHGKLRHLFRRPNFKSVSLPGIPGSAEFMQAYQIALADYQASVSSKNTTIRTNRTKPGSIADITVKYLNSPAFQRLASETKRTRRNILDRFRTKYGDLQYATLKSDHLQTIVNSKADTPSAARNFVNTVRAMLQFGVEARLLKQNPAIGLKKPKIKSSGYPTWNEEHIATFEAKYPIGTRERLALSILLYTGQRRSDVVKMGRQHIREGMLRVIQQKTGASLAIPIHPQLKAALDGTPSDHLTFLTTKNGSPFTPAGFTNWFRKVCNEAGLPKGISAHGLRKATCRRLAEAGCATKLIAAISGHKSLNEIERYTADAEQSRMAKDAMEAMETAFPKTVT